MIGYYVHHQGSGHLTQARSVARALPWPVTGLSSLARPPDWRGDWIRLPRDDGGPTTETTANGRLHWAPLHHLGLLSRSATLSAWLESARPRLVVSDVSVEVTLLARLHGVPVVSVVLPGRRDDPPHLLGYAASSALVAWWPPGVDGLLPGLPLELAERVQPLGALSRFPAGVPRPRRSGTPRVTLMAGSGGDGWTRTRVARVRAATPGWEWTVLGGTGGTWVEDPRPILADSDVVVTHAGQNALAEVASLRRPAVVVPEARPHEEQFTTAAVLAGGPWPVTVVDRPDEADWARALKGALALDGMDWSSWCDDHAVERFAEVVERLVVLRPEAA